MSIIRWISQKKKFSCLREFNFCLLPKCSSFRCSRVSNVPHTNRNSDEQKMRDLEIISQDFPSNTTSVKCSALLWKCQNILRSRYKTTWGWADSLLGEPCSNGVVNLSGYKYISNIFPCCCRALQLVLFSPFLFRTLETESIVVAHVEYQMWWLGNVGGWYGKVANKNTGVVRCTIRFNFNLDCGRCAGKLYSILLRNEDVC